MALGDGYFFMTISKETGQSTFPRLKSAIETPEQCVESGKSQPGCKPDIFEPHNSLKLCFTNF